MAYEADRVVVEVIAKMDGLDTPVKQSAASFDQSMGKIEASATRAERATGKTTVSAKAFAKALAEAGGDLKKVGFAADEASAKLANVGAATDKAARFGARHATSLQAQRAGMSQLGFQAQDVAQQFALGVKPMTIFAQQGGQVIQALQLMGGGGNKFLAFLGGPWGIGLSVAAVALSPLIAKLFESKDGVEELVEKLKEHARQTGLSEEADRIWTRTLDGLIDRQRKLNEELGKRLNVQAASDQSDLDQARGDLASLTKSAAEERARLATLRAQLAHVETPIGAAELGRSAEVRRQQLKAEVAETEEQLKRLEKAVTDAQGRITKGQIVVGEAQGKAIADLTANAQRWAELQTNILRTLEQMQGGKLAPLATELSASFETLKKAIDDAAGAGVGFDAVTKQSDALNNRLRDGQISVRTYTTEIRKLAKALQEQADAAKEAAKQNPKELFKRSVIGAEGTGPNKLGSSAAGFGQFMPSTWLSYFNRLFPDKAALSDAAKLGFRNVRAVADAVIDKATDDYVAVLKKAGQQITAANLYTVHLLGSKDASKFFAAAPSTDTSQVLSKQVLAGNPFLKGTIATAAAAIAKRIGDSSSAVSQGAAAIAQTLEQEKERLRRFISQREDIESGVIDARRALLTSAEDTAFIESMAVEAARQKYEINVKALQDEGKLLPEEAAELIKLNDERARLRDELVKRRENERKFREAEERNQQALSVQSAGFQAQAEVLQGQEQLARTSKERREIEQRLLDLQFAEEKMRLQYQIAYAERLATQVGIKDSEKREAEAQAAIARMKLQTLDQRHALATTANNQTNAGPIQSYLDSIPDKAAEIDQALEQVAANGLASFADGIASAVANFQSLGDVARNILQQITQMLIRMVVQQLILKAFGSFIGLSTGGAVEGHAHGGPVLRRAGGGYISGPGGPTTDSIPIMASDGEYVIQSSAAKKIGYRTLDYINRVGEMPHFAVGGAIRRVEPMNMALAGNVGRGGFSQDDIRQLRGIVSDAIAAQPDIALFPTIDPVAVLSHALGSKAGRRVMFDFMGQNSGGVKGAIR